MKEKTELKGKARELATRIYDQAREVESKADALKERLTRLDNITKKLRRRCLNDSGTQSKRASSS